MYFVYVLKKGPLGEFETHLVSGPRETVRRTRELICSGAQVSELMFVSEVMFEDETHHSRRHESDALHTKIDAALERAATPRDQETSS